MLPRSLDRNRFRGICLGVNHRLLARSWVASTACLANATSTWYSAGISCHSAARVRSIIIQSFEDRIRVEHYLAFLADHADLGRSHPDIQSGKLFHGWPPLA